MMATNSPSHLASPAPTEEARVVHEGGSGRSFILAFEQGSALAANAQAVFSTLINTSKAYLVELPRVTNKSWLPLAHSLLRIIKERGIRQASFVSFGAASAPIQHIALTEGKLVRTVVLVNAATRPHPSRTSRILDWIENHLPLGLPLRLGEGGFDAKPFLQRIRCPALVVTTEEASAYERSEADVLCAGLPTAWRAPELTSDDALLTLLLDFQEVPAKCPQKNTGATRVETVSRAG